MNFTRVAPFTAGSIGFIFATGLLGCSGSTSDPGMSNEGGSSSGGLPGVGGQSSGGTSNSGGATTSKGGNATTGNGGATTSQQGGNGNGGAAQGGATNNGGVTTSNGGNSLGGKATGGAANNGGTATIGGNKAIGGATNVGGVATSGGTKATGGTANLGGAATTGGNKATGGTATGGTATGGAATGGAATGGATSTGGSSSGVFSSCRFHFGTIDSKAKAGGTALISQLDFFTPGWMLGAAFDQQYVCDEGKAGAVLANQVPVVVAYVAAGIVKRDHTLCDCNVTGSSCGGGNLCSVGAQYIVQDWTKIINAYKSYSAGYAACYGTTRPIIFEMEPDWYQYTYTSQSAPWTMAQAGSKMSELVAALKTSLPNARFSIDASPWVGPSNGSDNGAQWYGNFNMSLFTFVNTSGGGTNAATQQCTGNPLPSPGRIRCSNAMTWAGLSSVTGKPILADTGYGVNGASSGPDPNWDSATNINARIADGVASIAQYNPDTGTWGATIGGLRSQLSAPKYCP